MQELIRIDGELMPSPVYNGGYSVTRSDLDSAQSGRSETGTMYRERIREGVYKLQLKWRVSGEELILITSAISPPAFEVEFFDPTTCTVMTTTMYAGDRRGDMLINSDAPEETLWDFSVNLIEY